MPSIKRCETDVLAGLGTCFLLVSLKVMTHLPLKAMNLGSKEVVCSDMYKLYMNFKMKNDLVKQ